VHAVLFVPVSRERCFMAMNSLGILISEDENWMPQAGGILFETGSSKYYKSPDG